ncbi:MAG TPA: glutamate formimidoyltransferase [Nitrospiraceae bacterium]|nr:glutamate formimidoyltransferase [Nitrospiraceae bacterium]
MKQIVECVANFSEGRNPETVRALVIAIQSVPGVAVLDETMDRDHHRSVVTFAGRPFSVAEAAFQATRIAAGLIDLRVHEGQHPRIGATDVLPFVPIRGVTMEECIELARLVGRRIGNELRIPVFLYEEAVVRPERRRLEIIRRGGLPGLAGRMESEAAWAPDFGPKQLHETAGATVVGARHSLIAFNVNLQTDDLEVARDIARTVRESSGGLPYVKAIGVALPSRGLVQVSMNLTNFEKTPLHVAFEAIRREAECRGTRIAGTELVGLLPQQALLQVAEHALKLERLGVNAIVESRLETRQSREAILRAEATVQKPLGSSLAEVSEAVSAKAPALTGAGAAALAAGLAATLGVMIARLNRSRVPERRLREIRTRLHELVQLDRAAYAAVLQAERISEKRPDRSPEVAGALVRATQVPMEIVKLSCDVVIELRGLLGAARPDVRSDLRMGIQLARGIVDGCLDIIKENMKAQPNQELMLSFRKRITTAEQKLVDIGTLCYTPPSEPWSQKILNKLKIR